MKSFLMNSKVRRAITYLYPLAACCALLVVFAWPDNVSAWSGTVEYVHDGDSLKVRNRAGKIVDIRLYGIDAPELENPEWPVQPHAVESRNALRQLLPKGTRVEVRVDQHSRSYGRTVATLILDDGRIINLELLKKGHAWFYGKHCREAFCRGWSEESRKARARHEGLWADAEPMPPWTWKRKYTRKAGGSR